MPKTSRYAASHAQLPSTFWTAKTPLILASGSEIRSKILAQVLIPHIVKPPDIDERDFEKRYIAATERKLSLSQYLATVKAQSIAAKYPESYVLTADQTCTLAGKTLHKPNSLRELKTQLLTLQGKTHTLTSSAVIAYQEQVVATCTEIAQMSMTNLTEDFIDLYVETNGQALLKTVGGYQIENSGPLLFSSVKGDYFTILGLPLLAILDEFRKLGLLLR